MTKNNNLLIKSNLSIVLAGEAGQGINTVENILLKLLKKHGLNVFSSKEFMSRVRGGLNSIQIRVSTHRVAAWIDKIDILLPLSNDISRLKHRIDTQTIIIGEKSKIETEWDVIDFSFENIAEEIGNKKYSNIVAVGFLISLFDIKFKLLEDYLIEKFTDKKQDIIKGNIEAGKRGYSKGKELTKEGIFQIKMEPNEDVKKEILVNGAEAVGMGAITGGCNFIGSYPMSPSTGVLEFLAGQSNDFPIAVEQAEDEIAALNMVLGSWYAGARGLATTSGGGFALMGEAMSLAGIIESPAVVHIAQRPGPGTGLPTRTEQGDLNLALYSGHGDFARVILAPGNPDEAFTLTALAFNLADEFQVPVIILTDQYLMDSVYSIKPWDVDKFQIKNFFIKTGREYQRYKYTKNNLSPRGIPGYGDGLVCVDSDEHTEEGRITEDWIVRDKMMDKRMDRLCQLENKALMPIVSGNPEGDVVVIGWGSTHNMILEAVNNPNITHLKYLHFPQVYPINPQVIDYLKEAEKIVVVENNYTGQFGDLLAKTLEIKIDEKILLSNGFPFSVESLLHKFRILEEEVK